MSKKIWETAFSKYGDSVPCKRLEVESDSPLYRQIKFLEDGLEKNNPVLDVGCGFGRVPILIAKHGFQVHAIDVSEKAVALASSWAKEVGVSIQFFVSSIEEFKFTTTYGAIRAGSIFDHLSFDQMNITVAILSKNLRKDGRLFCSFDGSETKEELSAKGQYEVLYDGTIKYVSGEYAGMLWRYCSDEEIQIVLEKNNFDIAEFHIDKSTGSRNIFAIKS